MHNIRLFYNSNLFICLFVCCVCMCGHRMAYMWRPEGNLQLLARSFHHVGLGDWTQVTRLVHEVPLSTKQPHQSNIRFLWFVCDNKSAISLRNCWCLLAMLGYTGESEGRLYQIVSSLGVVLDSASLSPVRTGLRHFCIRPSLRQRQSQCWLVDCCPLHRVAVWLLTTPYANNFLKTFKREFCLVQ